MYISFLSYNQLKDYLSAMIENNLLEYLEGTRTFKTTEKGLNFLKTHNQIGELLQAKIGNDEGNDWLINIFLIYKNI